MSRRLTQRLRVVCLMLTTLYGLSISSLAQSADESSPSGTNDAKGVSIKVVGPDGKPREVQVDVQGRGQLRTGDLQQRTCDLQLGNQPIDARQLLRERQEERAAADGDLPPIEFGRVEWHDDYDEAVRLSKKTGKPILLLFQEVPGCTTCQLFGCGPLSHPLLVDASKEFVPVAVRNNVGGKDREILEKFSERAWNNPVVRFSNTDAADLIPRKAGVYKTGDLLQRMVAALKAAKRPVPKYLELVAFEYAPARREWATFGVHCYWVGERKLGQLPGVLATRIGMLHGAEVVDVQFDPTIVSYEELLANAQTLDCTHRIFARTDAQQKAATDSGQIRVTRTDEATVCSTTQQFHLARRKPYLLLPLTALQATKVNAALASGASPDHWLSPTQLDLKERIAARLKQEPAALTALAPDRSPIGVIRYAGQLEAELNDAVEPQST